MSGQAGVRDGAQTVTGSPDTGAPRFPGRGSAQRTMAPAIRAMSPSVPETIPITRIRFRSSSK